MSSSTASVRDTIFATIATEAEAESPLWGLALRAHSEREIEPIFSELAGPQFGLAIESIYEGYLLHYARPRLFSPEDADAAVLLGDYLYAHGLVRLTRTGLPSAVADFAELISLCAQLRAEAREGDGVAWAATSALLGEDDRRLAEAAGALRLEHDAAPLTTLARTVADGDALDSALAAHTGRLHPAGASV